MLASGRGGCMPHSITLCQNDEGRILFFPSWLNHTVYPFYCDGERRSMSFNAAFFVPEGWKKK